MSGTLGTRTSKSLSSDNVSVKSNVMPDSVDGPRDGRYMAQFRGSTSGRGRKKKGKGKKTHLPIAIKSISSMLEIRRGWYEDDMVMAEPCE